MIRLTQLVEHRVNSHWGSVYRQQWVTAALLLVSVAGTSLPGDDQPLERLGYQQSLDYLGTNRPLVIVFSTEGVQGTVSNLDAITAFPSFDVPRKPTLYRGLLTDTGLCAWRLTSFTETSRILSGTNDPVTEIAFPTNETIVGIHGNVLWGYFDNHLVETGRSNTFSVTEQLLQALKLQPQDPLAIRLLSVLVEINAVQTLGLYGLEPGSIRINGKGLTANQTNGKEIVGQIYPFTQTADSGQGFQGVVLDFKQNNGSIQQAAVLHAGNFTNPAVPPFFPVQMVTLRKRTNSWAFERLLTVWSAATGERTITSDPKILFGSGKELFTMSNGMPYRLIGSNVVKAPGILNKANTTRLEGAFLPRRRLIVRSFVAVAAGVSIVTLVWLLASRKTK